MAEPGEPGNFQMHEAGVRAIVELETDGFGYRCRHFPRTDGRYQTGHIRLTEPHPKFGPQVRAVAFCPNCYQLLRDAGVATLKGLWEESDA